jgi:hypothetical protein
VASERMTRPAALHPPEDHGCCALDDSEGTGHQGPCRWRCSTCMAGGVCPGCDGWASEMGGCGECGGTGGCPDGCDEGWRTDE